MYISICNLCIYYNIYRRQNVAGIFAYTDWVNHQKWKNSYWKRYSILKSYGLIKHIVSQMLRMASSTGPYLVLYSGHDHTLEQISSALGLKSDPSLLRYASRLIFEVYQENGEGSEGAQGLYFRLLTNGKDITQQIKFCRDTVSLETKASLCKFEDIVRFIHDDYFLSLNVTNFKDACFIKSNQ